MDYGPVAKRTKHKNKSFCSCFSICNARYEECHATQHKYTQLDTSDTSFHKLVFVLLCAVIYNKQICHVITHIENFSGDFTFMASWLSGRA